MTAIPGEDEAEGKARFVGKLGCDGAVKPKKHARSLQNFVAFGARYADIGPKRG
jgi:hypothetical protein